ncbi:MAG: branched-chain amino acid ABC transporter permease [Acidobacteriota bacterium]|nr:branched-chain amino acid ABC transporter permease [Acidobacteriota bacterium]
MRKAAQVVGFLALLALLLALPKLVSSYKLLTYTRFLILALMAQGWNFIGGYTGYAAFGNVAYFGIGAYTTGLLMIGKWHVPFFPALAAGALLSACVAILLGLPILRLKGHYFAIATLGVAEALAQVADNWDSLTDGSTGIDLPIKSEGEFFYYTALGFVILGLLATWAFARSKIGYGCVAIREDQDAARMLGINTTLYKGIAYAISAVFAAIAGGITAYQNVHVTPGDFFKIDYTLQMIIATIIGGVGSVAGPVLGAAVYQLLSTYIWGRFIELHPTVLGFIIIFFIVFLPRGLMTVIGRRRKSGERPFKASDLLANVRAHRVT